MSYHSKSFYSSRKAREFVLELQAKGIVAYTYGSPISDCVRVSWEA